MTKKRWSLHGVAVFLFSLFLLAALSSGTRADECSFVGTKKCKMCHIKQYKSWKKTRMSQAFELLKPGVRADRKKLVGLDPDADYTKDETCVPCHVTGYGKPGGFVSVEETPDMAGVGCEVCHGAGSGYLQKGFMTMKNKEFKLSEVIAAGLVIPDESTCVDQCHNEKNPFFKTSPPFDWEKRKAVGTHEHFPLKYNHD